MKVSNLLHEYFERDSLMKRRSHDLPPRLEERFDLPVSPVKFGWERLQDPERLRRVFTFVDRASLLDFINMLIEYEDQLQHHGRHIIDHDQVTVEIYTKDLNRVTKTDLDYARYVDDLFKQASFKLPEPSGWSDTGL